MIADPLVRDALLQAVLLGIACGPLGVWVLLTKQAYAAEALAHGALPGLVLAVLAGIPLGPGAAAGVLLAAGLASAAGRIERIGPDVATGVAVTGLVGAGALLGGLPGTPVRLERLLFGDLLATTDGDLAAAAGLALLTAAALAAGHRPLARAVFDPSSARSLGGSPGRTAFALLGGLALALVVLTSALGALLALTLLLAPAVGARLLVRRLTAVLLLAAGFGALAGVLGIAASYALGTAAGASVALAALALPALAALRPRRA